MIERIIGKYSAYGDELEKLTFVYFITDNRYVKIGVADNVEARIKQLQTGNAEKLSVLAVVPCNSSLAAYRMEKELHSFFAGKRKCGEWFDILEQTKDCDYLMAYDVQTMAFCHRCNSGIRMMYLPLIAKQCVELGYEPDDKVTKDKFTADIIEEMKKICMKGND